MEEEDEAKEAVDEVDAPEEDATAISLSDISVLSADLVVGAAAAGEDWVIANGLNDAIACTIGSTFAVSSNRSISNPFPSSSSS